MSITDILAALGVLFDSLPQGLLAMAYGFAALPTAIGFGIGALLCLFFQLPTPVSFQAETTILAGGLGNNTRERISIIIFAGIAMLILGITGALSGIIGFIGQDILNGMLAGVGIILVKASLDLLKSNLAAGITSFATAVPIFLFVHNLIYACVCSVILGAAAFHIMRYIQKKNGQELVDEKYQTDERIQFLKPIYNHRILRGALAVIMLQIGGNISYGTITANMAHAAVDVDKLSIVGGMATATSGLFGGAPLASIISATGTAPHPVTSAVLLMALAAIVIGSSLFYKFGKLVPVGAVGGYLFVLGAILVFPPYAASAMTGDNPLVSGITAVMTAVTDPFIGMLCGVGMRFILAFAGAA